MMNVSLSASRFIRIYLESSNKEMKKYYYAQYISMLAIFMCKTITAVK